ncbi:uncharacterized protein LACBIDRAFT_305889 [Laccaria bicolor S238N-H82]|uniref:Predicted protein n=1 Tax=Laccaria bicolor (strain S238N-H82 / ATCC MYA-4686) TaxID=486041 RepID=B0CS64_LACBS|nr:uncharacterized protein LACBIDRAFT_305889 [Laccaria bicolor S238N-H82]EDR14793.1 predicted protein [Laccaria bicolor S238N-H82]|eukprot:XP_001875352.1 predicted protein [Laccaria bicolor S238N-H82]
MTEKRWSKTHTEDVIDVTPLALKGISEAARYYRVLLLTSTLYLYTLTSNQGEPPAAGSLDHDIPCATHGKVVALHAYDRFCPFTTC